MKGFKMNFVVIVYYIFFSSVLQIFLFPLFCSHWNPITILLGNKAVKSGDLRFSLSFVSQILSYKNQFSFLYLLLHCPNNG